MPSPTPQQLLTPTGPANETLGYVPSPASAYTRRPSETSEPSDASERRRRYRTPGTNVAADAVTATAAGGDATKRSPSDTAKVSDPVACGRKLATYDA